jgi:hypothetical protein
MAISTCVHTSHSYHLPSSSCAKDVATDPLPAICPLPHSTLAKHTPTCTLSPPGAHPVLGRHPAPTKMVEEAAQGGMVGGWVGGWVGGGLGGRHPSPLCLQDPALVDLARPLVQSLGHAWQHQQPVVCYALVSMTLIMQSRACLRPARPGVSNV